MVQGPYLHPLVRRTRRLRIVRVPAMLLRTLLAPTSLSLSFCPGPRSVLQTDHGFLAPTVHLKPATTAQHGYERARAVRECGPDEGGEHVLEGDGGVRAAAP